MHRISILLLQLDEARRYIEDGRYEHVRLALILLDNAAEVQMDWHIRGDLLRQETWKQLQATAMKIVKPGQGPVPPELRELIEWKPLSKGKRWKLDRFFGEKVDYLCKKGGPVDPAFAPVLKHLHKYRNEAYHRGEIRRSTVGTAARLLLEVNCNLALHLSRGGITGFVSNEDYSWLFDRFSIDPPQMVHADEFLPKALEDIRSRVNLDANSVPEMLADNIGRRIDVLLQSLDFIEENISACSDRHSAFKFCQYLGDERRGNIDPDVTAPEDYKAQFELSFVLNFRDLSKEIHLSTSHLEAFRRFATIENEFEPVEEDVSEASAEVDGWIQHQIDLARGK